MAKRGQKSEDLAAEIILKDLQDREHASRALRDRASSILVKLFDKWEKEMDNPDYKPFPSDVVNSIRVVETLDEVSVKYRQIRKMIEAEREEVLAAKDEVEDAEKVLHNRKKIRVKKPPQEP